MLGCSEFKNLASSAISLNTAPAKTNKYHGDPEDQQSVGFPHRGLVL